MEGPRWRLNMLTEGCPPNSVSATAEVLFGLRSWSPWSGGGRVRQTRTGKVIVATYGKAVVRSNRLLDRRRYLSSPPPQAIGHPGDHRQSPTVSVNSGQALVARPTDDYVVVSHHTSTSTTLVDSAAASTRRPVRRVGRVCHRRPMVWPFRHP